MKQIFIGTNSYAIPFGLKLPSKSTVKPSIVSPKSIAEELSCKWKSSKFVLTKFSKESVEIK